MRRMKSSPAFEGARAAEDYAQRGVDAVRLHRAGGRAHLDLLPPFAPEPTIDQVREAGIAFPEVAEPDVSIIIPVYNRVDITLPCLQALVRAGQRVTTEVIVVDDGSKDATARLLPQVPGLRFQRNAANMGFLKTCNAGVSIARGRYLCLLNNDTQVGGAWLDELVGTMRREPRAGMVGARLVFADGRLQEAGGLVRRDASAQNVGRLSHPDDPRYNYLRETDYCTGACVVMESAVFREMGGFDEHFAPAYYEETDLSFRMRARGLRVLYQPMARVVHFESVTTGTSIKEHLVVNRAKFFERWRETLVAEHFTRDTPMIVAKDRAKLRRMLVVAGPEGVTQRLLCLMSAARCAGFQIELAVMRGAELDSEMLGQLRRHGVETSVAPWVSSPRDALRRTGKWTDAVLYAQSDMVHAHHAAARRWAPQALLATDLGEGRAAEPGLADRVDLFLTASDASCSKAKDQMPSARVKVVRTWVVRPEESWAVGAPEDGVEAFRSLRRGGVAC